MSNLKDFASRFNLLHHLLNIFTTICGRLDEGIISCFFFFLILGTIETITALAPSIRGLIVQRITCTVLERRVNWEIFVLRMLCVRRGFGYIKNLNFGYRIFKPKSRAVFYIAGMSNWRPANHRKCVNPARHIKLV